MQYVGQSSGWDDVRLVYDGVAIIEERDLDDSGALLRRYYYEDGINKPALILDTTNPNVILITLTDDRGTVMGCTDCGGNLVEKLYYNTSGLCRSYNSSDVANGRSGTGYNIGRSLNVPFGYLGMYRDRFTGLYHTHFRDYDAIHSRWLSEDPAGYADGLNLNAAYMDVNGVDPLGLREQPWEWHHLFPQSIFGGGEKHWFKKYKPSYMQEKGMTIAGIEDYDEFFGRESKGLIIYYKDHTGKWGLGTKKYNKFWEKWIDELGRNGVTEITEEMLNEKLLEAFEEFPILKNGVVPTVSYKKWGNLKPQAKAAHMDEYLDDLELNINTYYNKYDAADELSKLASLKNKVNKFAKDNKKFRKAINAARKTRRVTGKIGRKVMKKIPLIGIAYLLCTTEPGFGNYCEMAVDSTCIGTARLGIELTGIDQAISTYRNASNQVWENEWEREKSLWLSDDPWKADEFRRRKILGNQNDE